MKKLFKIMLTAILLIFASVLLNVSASALSFDSALQYQTESIVTLWSKKNYEERLVDDGIGDVDSPFMFCGRSAAKARC